MRRRLRIALIVGSGLLLLILIGIGVFLWGLKQEPEFYRHALQVDRAVYEEASEEMIRRTMALQNALKKEGRWEAVFTQQQINGWLAVDLVENHPGTLPPAAKDPRVAIEPGRILLACSVEYRGVASIVNLGVEPYLAETNVLALRISRAQAGLWGMPLTRVLDQITKTASRSGFHLRWRQADGDPVALITIPALRGEDDRIVRIDTLEVGDNKVRMAGTVE